MSRKVVMVVISFVAIVLIIFGIKGTEIYSLFKKFSGMVRPGESVAVGKSQSINWVDRLNSVGTVTAVNGVNVTSQINGLVTEINFNSGEMVKKGQVLVHLDDRVEQAQLANYQAQLVFSKGSFGRQHKLFATKATAKSDLDQAISQLGQNLANVDKEKQIIDQKTIEAPFTGKLGIRKVNLGQYVNPGDDLVTLQSLNPLYVNFSLPEQDLSKLKVGQKVGILVDSYPGQEFIGKLTAISPLIASDTRSIALQATIPNKQLKLIPGTYAEVNVYMPKQQNVVVVPQTAVAYRLYGDSVYIVKDTGKKDKNGKAIIDAITQYVTVGDPVGDRVIITKGLKPNVEVVTAGQIKLQNKTRIVPNRTVNMN
ncbi:MAG: efflux RND transporter periplasmic adaptor subunit [Coxiellaceae bacterium]|nr:efflux RND transporter periplasmic adaptor subunit [Coxiellaceae bacterium]